MKTWFALTCPVCGFRYPLRKFTADLTPINYPVQVVCGGGYRRGFTVARRITWADLRSLDQTSDLMRAINCEYRRLAEAFDNFHFYLGYLSPAMKALVENMRQEIFRLQARMDVLTNRADRLQLMNMIERSDEFGRIEEIITRIQDREQRETKARRELLAGSRPQARNRPNQCGSR